jgi:hypothetical protein
MSLRIWALKPAELKPLTRAGRLVFSARLAMRVEPWRPEGASDRWIEALELVVRSAHRSPPPSQTLKALARSVSDAGAAACNRHQAIDEPVARCLNYSTQTLATAVELVGEEEPRAATKLLIACAKLSASIPAVLAHAGRVPVPEGGNPVDVACTTIWSVIRADIPLVAAVLDTLEASRDPVSTVREIAPLPPPGPPSWWPRR